VKLSGIAIRPPFGSRACDERTCGCLNLTYLHHDLTIADIAQECQSAETGDHLAQKLDPLAREISRQE
jgi:hypothetical protein